ncbi:unnamed protein product [Onchocerca ochengi]|nr:unnamed protein product [Onchocerca ochengi]
MESNSKLLEIGLIVICAAVHFFAPFNMAEGRSRYRYAVAYSVEAIEIVILLNMTVGYEHCTLPYKEYIMTGTYFLFLVGLFFMLLYYCRFHPNIVHYRAGNVPNSCVQACQIVLSTSNRNMEKS